MNANIHPPTLKQIKQELAEGRRVATKTVKELLAIIEQMEKDKP